MFKSLKKAGNPFEQVEMRVVNRTGGTVTAGMVLAFKFNLDSGAATDQEAIGGGPGVTGTGSFAAPAPYRRPDLIFANVGDPTNPAQDVAQIACVVTDLLDGEGANDTEIVVCIQGVCTVDAASANYDVGDALQLASDAATTNELAAYASADGVEPVAVCLTEEDSATSLEVMFWGFKAFGSGNEN